MALLAQRTRRRIDRRLMPFIFLLYVVSYLDRVNVGSAGLQMTKELGFSDSVFGLGSGLFFIGYVLLEIPGAVLAEVWSARKWIARILLTWGVLASATGLIHSSGQFYALRFLLGVAEAGFVPGILVYLSHWYRAEDRGKAVSLFFAGIPASQVVGGPLAAVLLRLHWLGWSGWRWLLLLEGLPAIALGILALFYLTEHPRDARWLKPEEQEWLAAELAREQALKTERVTVWKAMSDARVWLLGAVLFFGLNSNTGVSFWLPQIVQRLSGLDVSEVSLIASIPSLCALPLMLLVGWHSDRSGERIWHTAIPRLLSAAALAVGFVFIAKRNVPLSVALLSLAAIGFYCAHAGFWPLPNVFWGKAAAAAALGLVNSCGNLGSSLGPYVLGLLSDRTAGFGAGVLYLAGCSFASALLVLFLRGAAASARRPRSAANLVESA